MKRLNSIFPILAVVFLLSAVSCQFEAELAYTDGVDSIDQGLYAEAIEDFDKTIQLDPDDAMAYHARGIAYYNLDQAQRAIQDFDVVIQLDPDFTIAYHNRGITYSHLDQY